VNFGKTYFSEKFPDLWLFAIAAMFIGVVLVMPDGLAGVYRNKVLPWWQGRKTAGANSAVRTQS
jgi:urea transport system permease protein